MPAEQQRDLAGVEEAPAAGDGPEQILGPDDRVVLAEAIDLGLDVAAVGRVRPRHLLPAHLEVAAHAVVRLGLAVHRDLPRQQRVVGPASPTLYSITVTFSPPRLRSVWRTCSTTTSLSTTSTTLETDDRDDPLTEPGEGLPA
jgi:hypothetical protein